MRKVWIGIVVLLILASCGGIYVWRRASSAQVPEISTTITPSPAPEELVEWVDQAGFVFRYPKSLKSNIHPEDQENYAHIEFTHSDHPGTIIVWARDTTVADAAAWVKKETSLKQGTVFDTIFADEAGKKILLNTPKKKIITATVSDAIVFYVEGEFENSEYWTHAYDAIISSFAFTVDTSTAAQTVPVDEEEILE